MNLQELIAHLNELEIIQTSDDWYKNIPDKILNEEFENYKKVLNSTDIDEHRWYELATDVIQVKEGFMGVRHINKLYSERSDYKDIYHILEFFECEPVQTITYKKMDRLQEKDNEPTHEEEVLGQEEQLTTIVRTKEEINEIYNKVQTMYNEDSGCDEEEFLRLEGIIDTLEWLLGQSDELILPEYHKCPNCGSYEVEEIDIEEYPNSEYRYECMDCGNMFN